VASKTTEKQAWLKAWPSSNPVWRGVHRSAQNQEQAQALIESLPKLAAVGVNVVVVEVDYGFEFQSHPEARS
jgi:hypothetical protein